MLESVKDFLRVTDFHNDLIIGELIETAKELVEESTGKEYGSTALENMCIKLLVRHWFDSETDEVPYGVQTLLTQIEYR